MQQVVVDTVLTKEVFELIRGCCVEAPSLSLSPSGYYVSAMAFLSLPAGGQGETLSIQ